MNPDPEIVRAFQCAGAVERLAGGEGRSVRVGSCVLKPVQNAPRYRWACEVLNRTPRRGFRISEPRRTGNGAYVCQGWGATAYEPGKPIRGEWAWKVQTSRSFHAAQNGVTAPPIPPGDDIWSRAHEMAWQEADLPGGLHPAVIRTITALQSGYRPLRRSPEIIHADLCGNILFHDRLEPCIIDFSPAYGPASYADAILVADAIAWENAPLELLDVLPFSAENRQVLMRAICFRIIVAALHAPADLSRFQVELDEFDPVIQAIFR